MVLKPWNHIYSFTEQCDEKYVSNLRKTLAKRKKFITPEELEEDEDGILADIFKDISEKKQLCISHGSGHANYKLSFAFCSHCFKSKIIAFMLKIVFSLIIVIIMLNDNNQLLRNKFY